MYGNQHLGLDRHNITVNWYGKSGMVWEDVETKVRSLVQELGAPDILVIHCGGNSIGTCSLRGLQGFMKRIISNIFNMLPTYSKIVWSQILPRSYYIYMFSHVAAEKARKRINSSLSNFIRARGGCYINYPDLNECDRKLYRDGTHLTDIGQFLFLNTIQSALFKFSTENIQCYPPIDA